MHIGSDQIVCPWPWDLDLGVSKKVDANNSPTSLLVRWKRQAMRYGSLFCGRQQTVGTLPGALDRSS